MSTSLPLHQYRDAPAHSTRSKIPVPQVIPDATLRTRTTRRTIKRMEHGLTPAPFDGQGNGQHFLRQFQSFITYKDIKDPQIGPALSLLLRKDALDWYATLTTDQTKKWTDIKSEFQNHFTCPNDWDRSRQVYDTKQQPGQTLLDYVTKMTALGKEVLEEKQLIDCIISGLSSADRLFVIQQPHATLQDMLKSARLFTTKHCTNQDPTLQCHLTYITTKLDQLETSINTSNNINNTQFHPGRPTRQYRGSPRQQRTSHRSPSRRSTSPVRRRSPSPGKRCSFCGGKWHTVLSNCPARGKTCFKCRKLNHFKSMCKSQRSQ